MLIPPPSGPSCRFICDTWNEANEPSQTGTERDRVHYFTTLVMSRIQTSFRLLRNKYALRILSEWSRMLSEFSEAREIGPWRRNYCWDTFSFSPNPEQLSMCPHDKVWGCNLLLMFGWKLAWLIEIMSCNTGGDEMQVVTMSGNIVFRPGECLGTGIAWAGALCRYETQYCSSELKAENQQDQFRAERNVVNLMWWCWMLEEDYWIWKWMS